MSQGNTREMGIGNLLSTAPETALAVAALFGVYAVFFILPPLLLLLILSVVQRISRVELSL